MHYVTIEDLDNYKIKESGTYQKLVRSVRETWMDNTKPVNEQVFEILDIWLQIIYVMFTKEAVATTTHNESLNFDPYIFTLGDDKNHKISKTYHHTFR